MDTLTDLLQPGKKVSIFFNEGNVNNQTVEIRALVDDVAVVYKTLKGTYRVDDVSYWKTLFKDGHLQPIEN